MVSGQWPVASGRRTLRPPRLREPVFSSFGLKGKEIAWQTSTLQVPLAYPQLDKTMVTHFKKVGRMWSVRVGIHYRAVAVEDVADIIWFWIGHHSEYDPIVAGRRR